MTEAQRAVLTDIIEDAALRIRTVEYPSHPQIEGGGNECLKLVYEIEIARINRTFVDWYDTDGGVANTREMQSIDADPDSYHPSRGDYLAEPGL